MTSTKTATKTPKPPRRSGGMRARWTAAAKLQAAGLSPGEVAGALGVTRRAVERWQTEAAFRDILDREIERRTDRLRGPLDEALDVLAKHAAAAARRLVVIATTSEDESAAVRAAAIVLERAGLKSYQALTLDLSGVDDETLFAELERARAEMRGEEAREPDDDDHEDQDDGGDAA